MDQSAPLDLKMICAVCDRPLKKAIHAGKWLGAYLLCCPVRNSSGGVEGAYYCDELRPEFKTKVRRWMYRPT